MIDKERLARKCAAYGIALSAQQLEQLDRYAQLLCSDFSVDRLTALLDEMAAALRP